MHEEYLFIIHDALLLMTAKGKIEWMMNKGQLHRWLLPLNVLQDRTCYASCPVGNIPEFIPLYNSINHDILRSLRFHIVLSHCILDGEGIDGEERIVRFSYSTPREIAQVLKSL